LTDQRSSRLFYKNDVIDCIIRLEQRPLEPFITSAPLSFTNEMPNNLQELSHWDFKAEPNIRPMFNQMPSVTIQGALYPTADLNTLLDITTDMGESLKAQGYFNDYTGPTRSYIQEKGQLLKTGLLALIVIYLALLALYETWVDPLLILLTVPLALSGAIAAMLATSVIPGVLTVTSNIYTQLGLLTLLGLITKHGILLVQFAQERRQKDTALSIEAAARIGAQERFRPIVMTTAAMIVGVLPLLFASGPGAVSRFHLGFIIVFGLGIGTLFTLFILPVIYTVAHETLADRE
jgi:multidrug efflux pump